VNFVRVQVDPKEHAVLANPQRLDGLFLKIAQILTLWKFGSIVRTG
jgi:hypothetical protein